MNCITYSFSCTIYSEESYPTLNCITLNTKHMKTHILFFICLTFLISLAMNGKASIAPGNVKKEFSLKYPAAQNIKWYKQGKDFKVIFNEDGYNYQTKYNSKGEWLVTQRTITLNELPEDVKTNLSTGKFSTWKVNTVFVLFSPGMITQYRITISNDKDIKNLLFSWDGKLLDDAYVF